MFDLLTPPSSTPLIMSYATAHKALWEINLLTSLMIGGNQGQSIATDLLWAVDCSGSTTAASLEMVLHLMKAQQELGGRAGDVVLFDTHILGVQPMELFVEKPWLTGRGGSDLESVVDFYLKAAGRYRGIVWVTDGEVPMPDDQKVRGIPMCTLLVDASIHTSWPEFMGGHVRIS